MPVGNPDTRYLLYLHVPYCMVLCPFCSFHRVRFKEDSALNYFECLRREIGYVTDLGYRFDELYIGGGTPTVLPDELVRTLARVREMHAITGISVETNPDDLSKDSISRLLDAGVNRLSVGVQSFDDTLLKQMERYDKYGSGEQIRRALHRMDSVFDTLNVDMIFNFPHQGEDSLLRDIDILVDDIGVDQVSFYPLMTVASTRKKMAKAMGTVDYGREKQLYRLISARMLDAGYTRSSAWCFSRRADMFDEYIVERPEYVGLGSGAFSYLDGSLYGSTFSLNHYRRLVAAGKTGTTGHKVMNRWDRINYYLLMQLFSGAMDKAAAEAHFGDQFGRLFRPQLAGLRMLGAVRDSGDRISLTENGYYLWVVLMREFFTGVNRLRDALRHNIADERSALPMEA